MLTVSCLACCRQPAQRSNEIKVRFKTTEDNGMILFQNKGSSVKADYLALAVVRGRVEFSYNLGKQNEENLFILRSKVDVTDGQWHTALASRCDNYEYILFMAPHCLRAVSAYKDIRVHSFYHTHVWMHAHACMHTHTYMHARMHTHTHMHAHTYTCLHAHTYTCLHAHTHTHCKYMQYWWWVGRMRRKKTTDQYSEEKRWFSIEIVVMLLWQKVTVPKLLILIRWYKCNTVEMPFSSNVCISLVWAFIPKTYPASEG